MAAYVPYLILAGGAWLLVLAAMVGATGILNRLLFKVLPALFGAALIWSSAVLFLMLGGPS